MRKILESIATKLISDADNGKHYYDISTSGDIINIMRVIPFIKDELICRLRCDEEWYLVKVLNFCNMHESDSSAPSRPDYKSFDIRDPKSYDQMKDYVIPNISKKPFLYNLAFDHTVFGKRLLKLTDKYDMLCIIPVILYLVFGVILYSTLCIFKIFGKIFGIIFSFPGRKCR